MLVSMTGFGRSVHEAPFGRLVAEIQTVNRKYLEIFVSLPKELNRYELEIRKWVGESISRGQVNVRLFFTPSIEALSNRLPDAMQLKSLREAWIKIAKTSGCDENDVDLPFLLQNMPPAPQDEGEDQLADLKSCVDVALKSAVEMKRREGQALAKDIGVRLNILEKIVGTIETHSPGAVQKLRDKLRERMQELLVPNAELDERLYREIALFAEKVDIAEEITRLHSHLAQFRDVLKEKTAGQAGRKLDFLVQEMGREMNTIGSKSADAAITRLVVEYKSELEKIREQIQNIE